VIHESLESLSKTNSVDDLVYTAVFSSNEAVKAEARKQIHLRARRAGAVPSSIASLYRAIGRGDVTRKFTVPAFNIRALTYDVTRALFRAAMRHNVGPFIFEIARSEIGYTEQRPGEYAACVLGAALAEGYKGPVFIQGDHFQASAKKWATPEGKQSEIKALESLIDEAIAAEFYNIDIDTSTLVDLSFPTRDEQQRANYTYTAHFTKTIRARQPKGIEVSIGGEIGEAGGTTRSPTKCARTRRAPRRRRSGMAKISVQTGTSHGGVPMADARSPKPRSTSTLRETTHCRQSMASPVAHGVPTLPEKCSTTSRRTMRWRSTRHRLPEHDPRCAGAARVDEGRDPSFASTTARTSARAARRMLPIRPARKRSARSSAACGSSRRRKGLIIAAIEHKFEF
jgi:hypothetical protein